MLSKLSNMELFYLGCAIVGGGLFVLRSLMMLIGLGGESHDAGDAIADSDGSPVHDFKMISVHSLTAFALMFGLVGFLMLHNQQGEPWVAGATGFGVGLVTMAIIAKIFQSSRKLQSDGTIYPANAVGAAGSVYLAIRPGEIGKVQLTVRGALKVFDARAQDPAVTLKTGDPVKVVGTEDVLVVERV